MTGWDILIRCLRKHGGKIEFKMGPDGRMEEEVEIGGTTLITSMLAADEIPEYVMNRHIKLSAEYTALRPAIDALKKS